MKSIEEIYQEMREIFTQRTGLDAGADGDLAVRFYAVAAQIHALYLQAAWTQRQCFPQTATEDYLDYHAALRGVTRKEEARAEGILRFSVAQAGGTDLGIPQGTVCMTAGLVRFETTREGTLTAGETAVDIPARALEAGAAGNAAAGSILTMAVAPAGIAACVNPESFSGGADREDDETLRVRVLETYRRLANGANAAFYEQKAMSFEEVAAVSVVPRRRGVGTVDVVIATLAGVPEEALVARVQDHFEQVREIAVDVRVLPPTVQPVDVTVGVRAAENYAADTVLEAVRHALTGWFSGQRLGRSVLRAKLGELIYRVEGVENYAISAPTADVTVECDVLPILGTLRVEAMD